MNRFRRQARCGLSILGLAGLWLVGLEPMARKAVRAQDASRSAPAPATAAPPPARPADVESIDSIVRAVYETVSGEKGQARDWDRFRSLFVPGAKMIPVAVPADPNASPLTRVLSIDEFVTIASANVEKAGFYESELRRKVEKFGHMAHVWSTYESRRSPTETPFTRGINSFQLFHDGKRWYVVSVFWDNERPGSPLPEE